MHWGQTGESANAATTLGLELSMPLPFQKQLKFSFGRRQKGKCFTYIKHELLKDIYSMALFLWLFVACSRNVELGKEDHRCRRHICKGERTVFSCMSDDVKQLFPA